MNFEAVDLNSPYERSQNLMEPYTFDQLLIEVACNLREISTDTVRAQARESIKAKYNEALEILESNLLNITQTAQKERNIQ